MVVKDWTVLVYMGADDDDDTEMVVAAFQDLEEMRSVGSSDRVNVAVQMDLRLFPPVRFKIQQDGSLDDKSRGLGLQRESSAGRPQVLSRFLDWARQNVPARRYLLVLWGHGLGVGFNVEEISSNADVVFDADDGLEIPELGGVLRRFKRLNGKSLDLLGFDACYMCATEVAYQYRGLVGLLVGSQITIPFQGWPYERVLKALRARPERTPESLAKQIAREVVKSYPVKTDVTQTVLRPAGADNVGSAVQELVAALDDAARGKKEARAIQRAFTSAKFLKARQFLDLRDLCARLARTSRDPRVKASARAAAKTLAVSRGGFIVEHRTRGPHARGLNGASIYVRRMKAKRGDEKVNLNMTTYRKLQFVQDTEWQTFSDRFARSLRRS